MTETIYQVLTPAGAFQVAFGDDETPITEYRGDELAIQFFKNWLLISQASGQDGWRISADSLDPSDLYGFCQPPGSGITVLPPFEDLVSYVLDQPDEQEPETMTAATLDAATGREALQLAKELKQIRAGIAELTGRAALTAAKRIREIRQALGVGNKTDSNGLDSDGYWVMTQAEYKKIHKDYRGTLEDGTPSALKLINGATTLVPVRFSDKPAPVETPKTTIADVNAVMPLLKQFIGKSQLAAMGAGVRGEEGQFFKDKFVEVAKVIEGMPHTYQTDGQGDKAVAYLHYFKGGMDWYITEKDVGDAEDEKEGISGQIQAFGYADLGHGGELGYISIKELIESGVELDLYWSPKSIGAIKGKDDAETKQVNGGLSDAQKMKDAIISWGGEVVLEMNDSAIAFELRGTEYNDKEPPYLKFDGSMYRVHYGDGFTDNFDDPWKAIEAYSIAKKQQANTMTTEAGLQDPIKTAFIAELEALKSETDIETFNNKLDEIAARIEQAGLMETLDQELNDAADVLTELLAAAENS